MSPDDLSFQEHGGEPLYREGDRCRICGHWFWNDGHWHSLVPKLYADDLAAGREVLCPTHAAEAAAS